MTPRVYDSLVTGIADAVCRAARHKHVALLDEECFVVARSVLADFHPKELRCLAKGELSALTLAANAVNRALDVIAAGRALRFAAVLQGVESDGDTIMARARAIADGMAANDATGTTFRWPDPAEAAMNFFAPRPALAMSPSSRVSFTLGAAAPPPLVPAGAGGRRIVIDTALLRSGLPEFIVHPYGVEVHPTLPPLPAEPFRIMRQRAATRLRVAAGHKGMSVAAEERGALATLIVAFFHRRGLGGMLYCQDEAAILFHNRIIDWTLEHRPMAVPALAAALDDPDGRSEARPVRLFPEVRFHRTPLPADIHERVHIRVEGALQHIARRKNALRPVAEQGRQADEVVSVVHAFGVAESLLLGDPEAIALMEQAIDRRLDRDMAGEAVRASVEAAGADRDGAVMLLWIDEALRRLRECVPEGSFYRWPDGGIAATALAEFGILIPAIHGGAA